MRAFGYDPVLALALVCGLLYYVLRVRAAGRRPLPSGAGGLLFLAFGFAGARLFFFFSRINYLLPMYGWGHLTSPSTDSLAFGGAVLGLLAAGFLLGRILKGSADRELDLLAPAALLSLMIARAGEYFTAFGDGAYVENPALQFFPLARGNEWGEWYYAVFVLESLTALAVLIWALRQQKLPDGETWRRALLFILLAQVFLESLRAESIRWGFVRVQQLFSVLGAAALLLYYLRSMRRRGEKRLWPYPLGCLLGAAALIGLEFALDKWLQAPRWALYIAMIAVLAGMGALVLSAAKKSRSA